MILDRVTITGADDSIKVKDLIPLTNEYPFVEWGILLSKSSEGSYRFPTRKWMNDLWNMKNHLEHDLDGSPNEFKCKFSGHICGKWVRDICDGNWTLTEDLDHDIYSVFDRFQLNFHAQVHNLNKSRFLEGIKSVNLGLGEKEFIFQIDDVNNHLLTEARGLGINASPLFDLSGGAGILPKSWPKNDGKYTGYAGGLSPENVVEQLEKIQEVAGDSRIWIDVERNVRSIDDSKFDLDKVSRFLEATKPFVNG